jgi:phosphoribosyl-ATP pyrophosphohydrolase
MEKYNAIVDIRETGKTLTDNSLVVYDSFSSVQTGLVFRRRDYDPADYQFSPWKLYAEIQTLRARLRAIEAGAEVDSSPKSASLLLSDQNRRIKAIGEEAAELVMADVSGDNLIGEIADNDFMSKVTATANGISYLRCLNESFARNKNPELWLA